MVISTILVVLVSSFIRRILWPWNFHETSHDSRCPLHLSLDRNNFHRITGAGSYASVIPSCRLGKFRPTAKKSGRSLSIPRSLEGESGVCISFPPRWLDVPAVMTYPPGVCHMASADLGEYNRPLRFQYNVDRGIVCHESFEDCPPESRVFSLFSSSPFNYRRTDLFVAH